MKREQLWPLVGLIVAVIALCVALFVPGGAMPPASVNPAPVGVAMQSHVPGSIYNEFGRQVVQSGAQVYVESGGEIEVASGGILQADVISETTAATGVTVDGVLLKDGALTGTTTITAADLVATDDLDVGDDARIVGDLSANAGTFTTTVTAADLTASDDLVVGDDATVAGDLIANAGTFTTTLTVGTGLTISDGNAVVADTLRLGAQTAITVTDGDAFTVTGTYQPIQAAGEVTPTVTVGTVGDLVVLVNIGTEAINLAAAGTMKLSAAWAAGQYDTLMLWCDGTNWLEISRSNN